MNDVKIDRIYNWQENTELKINCIKEFVRVERHHNINLTPAEEFTLYVLRIHYDGYSASQGVYADFMDVSANRISEYTDSLQEKGFLRKHEKPNGRSVYYEMLREPEKNWNKIPKSFIRDHYIEWKDRLFIIKLFNLILIDVNEIHYIDKDIAKSIGITAPTFRHYRDALVAHGIIEKLPKTYTNSKGGYRIDIDELFGLIEKEKFVLKPVYQISSYRYKQNLVKKSMR